MIPTSVVVLFLHVADVANHLFLVGVPVFGREMRDILEWVYLRRKRNNCYVDGSMFGDMTLIVR